MAVHIPSRRTNTVLRGALLCRTLIVPIYKGYYKLLFIYFLKNLYLHVFKLATLNNCQGYNGGKKEYIYKWDPLRTQLSICYPLAIAGLALFVIAGSTLFVIAGSTRNHGACWGRDAQSSSA
jgi:hypothetical protein